MASSKVRPVRDLDGRVRRIGSRTTGSGSSYFSEQPISGAYVNGVVYGVGTTMDAKRGLNRRRIGVDYRVQIVPGHDLFPAAPPYPPPSDLGRGVRVTGSVDRPNGERVLTVGQTRVALGRGARDPGATIELALEGAIRFRGREREAGITVVGGAGGTRAEVYRGLRRCRVRVGFKLTLSNQTMTAQAMAPAQMMGMNRLGRSLTSCIRLHPPRVFGSPAASTIRSSRLCASTSR
jgi:hypothetical protein